MAMVPRTKILALTVVIGAASSMTVSAAAIRGAPSDTDRPPAASRADLEREVVDLVVAVRGLPIRDGSFDDRDRYCPRDQIKVTWTAPEGTYPNGAYIEPLGPAPGPDTVNVNGIAVCESSTYAYMGFEALRTATGWDVVPVPDFAGDDDDVANLPDPPAESVDPKFTPRATPPPAATPGAGDAGGAAPTPGNFTAAIEPYAAYDPQSSCSPSPKPGMLAFRSLVLSRYEGTGSLGISRNCSAGGLSEHKEGRAWDWRVNVNRPAERAGAQNLINWLFATDEFGNRHAMARRLGVMYMVWNHQIWGSYRASQGWRPYHGASAHTDHVHFSFARAGAAGKTSFWTGVPASMPGAAYAGWSASGSDVRAVRDTSRTSTRGRAPRHPPTSQPSADEDAPRHRTHIHPPNVVPSWTPQPQPTSWSEREHRHRPRTEPTESPATEPVPAVEPTPQIDPAPQAEKSDDEERADKPRARRGKRGDDHARRREGNRPEWNRDSWTQRPERDSSRTGEERRTHKRGGDRKSHSRQGWGSRQ